MSGKKIAIISAVATLVVATAGFILWLNGAFLPGWIEWESATFTVGEEPMDIVVANKKITVSDNGNVIWKLDDSIKVQSALTADIDRDGHDELLVLCWRIGRYGDRRPFWVKRDEFKWSQHIYIYETDHGRIKAKWMASDIKQFVKSWTVAENRFIVNTSPEGETSNWVWISWGLERIENIERFGKTDVFVGEIEADDNNKASDSGDNGSEIPKINGGADELPEEGAFENDPDKEVSILMVGDVLLHEGVANSCKDDNGDYDFSPIFENTKDVIQAADIAIVNQEVIIGGKELRITGYPSFNGPYELADALYDAGFDVICHATNHALDRGKTGIINCLNNWREKYPDMAVLGIYDNEEDSHNIYICESNGIKVAILNYTYGTNGIPLPNDMPYAVNLLSNKEKIVKDLAYAEENADFTVVCPHWGIEYQLKESADQQKWAEFLVENGADLIIGTHPHVIEPVEWVEASNGNTGLCYYSLGNYINWTAGRGLNVANRMIGGMAYVTISDTDDGNDSQSVTVKDYTVYPLVSHVEHHRGNVTTYFLGDYTEEKAEINAIREQDSSFSLKYCLDLCEKVWDSVPLMSPTLLTRAW